ncbi:MAG TPA: hypothetical protein K8W23_01725 [Sellimonas intestinalis]|uniref:hypothetical protein n=1 Tax=Sellimonas sp. TaxID=2021466 RepID=UPI000B39EE5E|nr:hypothetical protein [Sellimonas sp.]OUP62627.1 hypothetical protein B5F13_12635 [Drancourtella sp. An177]HJE98758.1 hypothetical protein [Sellimonas intestinalis]
MDRAILETIIEMAALYGCMAVSGELDLSGEDSSVSRLYDNLENWAKEFEAGYPEDRDYYEEIEAFMKRKFAELGWMEQKTMGTETSLKAVAKA